MKPSSFGGPFLTNLAHQICHMISGLKLFETSYDEIPRAKLRVDHSSTVLWAAQDQRPYIERCACWALVKVWWLHLIFKKLAGNPRLEGDKKNTRFCSCLVDICWYMFYTILIMSFLMAFLYLTNLVDLASTGWERADVLGLYPQRFPQTLRLVGWPYRTSRPTFWCPVMFVGL